MEGNCRKFNKKSSAKELYRGIRNLTKKFRPTNETIKDKNGSTLCNVENIKEGWKQYCEDLYKTNDNITQNLRWQSTFITVNYEKIVQS